MTPEAIAARYPPQEPLSEAHEDLPVAVDAVLRLTGETAALGTLSRQATPDPGPVLVDRLAESVAAQFARDLAALVPATAVFSGADPR